MEPTPEHYVNPTGSDAFSAFLAARRFHSLDGLRFFSVSVVIWSHVVTTHKKLEILNHGWLGVDLFFIISGFLITTLLIRERAQFGDISLMNFYLRRTFRIFPIYYLLVFSFALVYLVISPWKPNGWKFYSPAFPILLTYTSNFIFSPRIGVFFHCWSLAAEEQFYLVWPAIEKYFSGARKWAVYALLLLTNQLVNFGFFDSALARIYNSPHARQFPFWSATFTPILLGVLLAHLLACRATFAFFYCLLSQRIAPVVILLAVVASFQWVPQDIEGPPRLILHLLLTSLVAALVIAPGNYLQTLLDNPWVVRFGAISYGMYMYHVILAMGVGMALALAGITSQLAGFVGTMVATICVAELSFRFVETPFLRLKMRVIRRQQEMAPAPAG